MKRLLFGLIAVLMVACSTSVPPPDEAIGEVKATPAPTVGPAEVAGSTEGSSATESPTVQLTRETVSEIPESGSLPVIRPAPELENEVWLNTDEPLRLADLSGQVVLIDMWTFG